MWGAFVPTMKPLDAQKKEKTPSLDQAMQQATEVLSRQIEAMPATEGEPIDFSKVEIEPLFKDSVDFETFSKSDFRAVKVLAC